MTFIWGLQDSFTNTQSSEILGFEFKNNSEPFAVFNLVQSFAVLIFTWSMAFINKRGSLYVFIIATGIAGLIMCGIMFKFKYEHDV
jgi:hypothetical protein